MKKQNNKKEEKENINYSSIPNYSNSQSSLSSYLSLTNSVGYTTYNREDKKIRFHRDDCNPRNTYQVNKNINYPLLTEGIKCLNLNSSNIKVPNKVEYTLRNYTSRKALTSIHKDIEVAIEMCLLFTTNFSSTEIDYENDSYDEEDESGLKPLRAKYLRQYFSTDPLAYKRVRDVLETPTKRGSIIECDHVSVLGEKSFYYRLGDAYRNKGTQTYTLKTEVAKELYLSFKCDSLEREIYNPIILNLLNIYPTLQLPSLDEIMCEAKRLVKARYKNKKGKTLRFLNKHPRSYFKTKSSFVEDDIQLYKFLIEDGLMVPKAKWMYAGGRIVDAFVLMPSWIRNLIRIDGVRLDELDYSCLHPNIAISRYGGNTKFLTHAIVANNSGIEKDIVKEEHLSFFNKEFWQMKKSPLFQYYLDSETVMLNNIINEKFSSEHKHKATARTLFKIEVDVMADVITQLNSEGIFVLYVYDALRSHPRHTQRVKEIMDATALKHGIHTLSKVTFGEKSNLLHSEIDNYKPISYTNKFVN